MLLSVGNKQYERKRKNCKILSLFVCYNFDFLMVVCSTPNSKLSELVHEFAVAAALGLFAVVEAAFVFFVVAVGAFVPHYVAVTLE